MNIDHAHSDETRAGQDVADCQATLSQHPQLVVVAAVGQSGKGQIPVRGNQNGRWHSQPAIAPTGFTVSSR